MRPLVLKLDRPFREGQRVVQVPDPTGETSPAKGVWVEDSTGFRRAGFVVEITIKRIEVPRPRLLRFLPSHEELDRRAKVKFSEAIR